MTKDPGRSSPGPSSFLVRRVRIWRSELSDRRLLPPPARVGVWTSWPCRFVSPVWTRLRLVLLRGRPLGSGPERTVSDTLAESPSHRPRTGQRPATSRSRRGAPGQHPLLLDMRVSMRGGSSGIELGPQTRRPGFDEGLRRRVPPPGVFHEGDRHRVLDLFGSFAECKVDEVQEPLDDLTLAGLEALNGEAPQVGYEEVQAETLVVLQMLNHGRLSLRHVGRKPVQEVRRRHGHGEIMPDVARAPPRIACAERAVPAASAPSGQCRWAPVRPESGGSGVANSLVVNIVFNAIVLSWLVVARCCVR